ncbi:PPOX class F420-dependent oxidoreductase [Kribbella sp. CA-294648]|uniref:PPOX class F420-dependent oxidoreductase n=1 Tax=Kribbella sp. CA-294648 TaxID=3239948 RepID=UPI003D91D1EC
MRPMTATEWRSFVTTGTRLGHLALTRSGGRPHITPVCFILDGDELAFLLSPGSVKGKILSRDPRVAVCVSDEHQPYGFVTLDGQAQISAEPDQIEHIAGGIADRYYSDQPRQDIVASFLQEGFTAVHIGITKVVARTYSEGEAE